MSSTLYQLFHFLIQSQDTETCLPFYRLSPIPLPWNPAPGFSHLVFDILSREGQVQPASRYFQTQVSVPLSVPSPPISWLSWHPSPNPAGKGFADRTFSASMGPGLRPFGSSLTHTLLWAGMDGVWVGKAERLNATQQGTKTPQFQGQRQEGV